MSLSGGFLCSFNLLVQPSFRAVVIFGVFGLLCFLKLAVFQYYVRYLIK